MTVPVSGLRDLVDGQATPGADANRNERERIGKFIRVLSRTHTNQTTATTNDGDAYLIPTGASGAEWSVNIGKIAVRYDGTWNYFTPAESWRVWVNDEDLIVVYNGSAWVLDSKMPTLSVNVAGSSNVTLTEEQSRYPVLALTGTLTGNINLIVTTTPKLIIVYNGSAGAFTLTVKTASGSGIVVSQGTRALLYCDGTNVVSIAGVAANVTGDRKESVRAASTGNVNIASAPSSIDSVTLASGDRVLLKDQSAGAENGIYVFNGAGSALTRAPDADTSDKVTAGLNVIATEGGLQPDTFWVLTTNDPIVLGATALSFAQLSGGGGGGTFLALSDVPDSYTGHAKKVVRVNSGETAVEFRDIALDDEPQFKDVGDTTRQMRIDAASVPASTTVVINAPAASGSMARVEDISGGGNGDDALAYNSGGSSALTYAFYAGGINTALGLVAVSAGTLSLTDDATNYVEVDDAGVVSFNTTGFTFGRYALAEAVTAAGAITGVTDRRYWIVVPALVDASLCNGRLTLESGVPVSSADQTAKTTVYMTPYKGNRIALYDGTRWRVLSFSEVSLALGTLSSGKNYDVFGYINAGALALELSAAWTNDTTRADALTTQDGVLVKSGATTRRYLGTFRTTSTTTTEDSKANRLVWSAQNRVPRAVKAVDTTDSWAYSTASFRQANGSTANQIGVVAGLSEDSIELTAQALASSSASGVRSVHTGIGVNSTTVSSADIATQANVSNTILGSPVARLLQPLAQGYSFFAWLERGNGTDTQTWYGDIGVAHAQMGLLGRVLA